MKRTATLFSPWLAAIALGASLSGQSLPYSPVATVAEKVPATVSFDRLADGQIWALGTTYKASFGGAGFVYVPFFGSTAPRNYPVQFILRSVRVGGHEVAFAADVAARREGTRVTFGRGAVHEIYDLMPSGIEQTFVIDGERAGDVDVELEVTTDLRGNATQNGLRFANHLGAVTYGTAYLVDGARKSEIATTWNGSTLRLRVPGAQRGVGAVVIDPMIGTTSLTPTLMASTLPDIAYDATTDRWLATWVHVFSQADHDVVAELRSTNGQPVAGSFTLLDLTDVSFTSPRTANLNSADRFLIAMERLGTRSSVWGRTLNATSPFGTSQLFEISPPSNLNQGALDVGGDSGTGTRWLVAWVHGGSSIGAADVLGRQVEANGTVLPNTIRVETLPSVCTDPQVSLSNGNGLTPQPRWCVVYNEHALPTDADVRGTMIDLAGNVIVERAITLDATNDVFPQVSSPLVDVDGQPRFLVSYEQWSATSEMVARVVDSGLVSRTPQVNLTRRYGFDGAFSRVESDGTRFAATTKVGSNLRVGTLAFANDDIVLHETPQVIAGGDFPHIASKRSGGGPNTEYGIVYISSGSSPRASLGLYHGRAPAGGITHRGTSCGLGIDTNGQATLGATLQVALSNVRNDVVGLLLGGPAPAVPLCPNCAIGVDIAQPVIALPTPLNLRLPTSPRFVGATVAVQGYAIGSGTCGPAALRLSDTVDITLQ